MSKIRIAILASGSGSNALKLIDAFIQHQQIEIGFLLSNKETAPIVASAKNRNVKVVTYSNEQVANAAFMKQIFDEEVIDYIILAGYLRKIPEELISDFPDRIINVHPALLPNYGGQGMYGKFVHEAVLKAGEKETGITFHYVNEHFDEGRKIAQFYCPIEKEDTLEAVQKKVQILEHAYFAFIVENNCKKKRNE